MAFIVLPLIYFLTSKAFAAACCQSSPLVFSALLGHEKSRIRSEYQASDLIAQSVNGSGEWIPPESGDGSIQLTLSYLTRVSEKWQLRGALLLKEEKLSTTVTQTYFLQLGGNVELWSAKSQEWVSRPTILVGLYHLLPVNSSSKDTFGSARILESEDRLTTLTTQFIKTQDPWDARLSFSLSRFENKMSRIGNFWYQVQPYYAAVLSLGVGMSFDLTRFGVSISHHEIEERNFNGAINGVVGRGQKSSLSLETSLRFNEDFVGFVSLFDDSLLGRPRRTPLNRGLNVGIDLLSF